LFNRIMDEIEECRDNEGGREGKEGKIKSEKKK
jgi:hypothetical protein